MRVSVDDRLCEGHGQCYIIDLDLFPLDETGRSAVGRGKAVPPGEEDQARIGVASCPVAALSIDSD